MQPQLLITLLSNFLLPCAPMIRSPPSPALSPAAPTCTWNLQMWKLLGGWGGEENERNVMPCMSVPLPCLLPLPPLTIEPGLNGGRVWDGGWGPCCNDAYTVFCCIPQPSLSAWQVIRLQSGSWSPLPFMEVSVLSDYFTVGETMV